MMYSTLFIFNMKHIKSKNYMLYRVWSLLLIYNTFKYLTDKRILNILIYTYTFEYYLRIWSKHQNIDTFMN